MTRRALMKSLAGAAILALTLFAGGCVEQEIIGGVPRKEGTPTIISLAPSATEVVGKTLNNGSLVGRTADCNFPMNLRASVVTNGIAPDFEKITELQPSFVIYDAALIGEQQAAKIKELGFETIAYDPNNLEEYRAQAFQVAKAIGGELNVSEYLDKVDERIEAGRAALETAGNKPRIALLIGAGGSYLGAGQESLWADLVKRIGGETLPVKGTAYMPVSLEGLVAFNPGVILTGKEQGAGILADPQLASIEAVRTRRVYEIEEDILVRRGGRMEMMAEAISTALIKAARGS
ncbi:MAG: ABC transporter substrate-binding protein [Fimbriimonadaceae bacterium]|nr:ABC transporter substrate-binding protein [Fimbriimonadaceae bacterium]